MKTYQSMIEVVEVEMIELLEQQYDENVRYCEA
jgi:hypothetical protein